MTNKQKSSENMGYHIESTEDAIDLVCGMELGRDDSKFFSEHNGVMYFFCSQNCKTHFDNDPGKYTGDK